MEADTESVAVLPSIPASACTSRPLKILICTHPKLVNSFPLYGVQSILLNPTFVVAVLYSTPIAGPSAKASYLSKTI